MTTLPTQLGPYTIDREIGRGGMGVVYLGHDTNLNRAVAIKALPEHLASDPDRLARFEHEARTLAQLSHANVAGIHGVEEAEGAKYLVLEYVEGETLAERLDRGPLEVDEALAVCVQIAAGVEAAHEAGVIHRDLKPGNVKITPDGKVKVLDFGLAKASETTSFSDGASGELPTISVPAKPLLPTRPGVIMGTAPYMSPEQARGRRMDKRTDIWSFGVILYECLTGASPFSGETASDSIGAILHKNVDLDRLPGGTPASVRRTIQRCLQRDKNDRYRDIGDVRLDLAQPDANDHPTDLSAQRASRMMLPWSCAALGMLLSALAVWSILQQDPASPNRAIRFEIPVDVSTLATGKQFTISPDGGTLSYVDAQGRVYIRRLDEFRGRLLHNSHDARSVFFSPNGQWVGFWSDGELKKIPADGGLAISIAHTGTVRGATWGSDGEIVFTESVGGLKFVSENGGPVRDLANVDPSLPTEWISDMCILPDGQTILLESIRGIEAVDRRTGRVELVIADAAVPCFVPPGDLLHMHENGTLWTAPFDSSTLELTGEPVLVRRDPVADFVAAGDGTLVFVPLFEGDKRPRLVWVDRTGAIEALALEEQRYRQLSLSPGSRFAAVAIENEDRKEAEIWVVDLDRGVLRRLTRDAEAGWPVWTHAGTRIVYVNWIPDPVVGLIERPADGSGTPVKLDLSDRIPVPMSWSEQNKTLAFYEYAQQADIWTIAVDGDPEPFIVTAADERAPAFSPDGKWMAFVTDESGRDEIQIRDFPIGEIRILVSEAGGTEPRWARDGRSISYRHGVRMMSVGFDPESPDYVDKPVVLFEDPSLAVSPIGRGNPNYDQADDGRFLMVQNPETQSLTRLHVVLNWDEELRRSK